MQIRGQFKDFFFESMLPALDLVIKNEFGQYPEFYTQLFQVKQTDRSIMQTTQLSGVGLLSFIGEAENISMDMIVQGFDKTFKPRKFGLAIPTTDEMVKDDKWGLVNSAHQSLSRSLKETIEIQASRIFNYAFATAYGDGSSALGPDGKRLCATDHPLVKSGGVQSNTSTAADLSYTSLQYGLTDFETMRDAAGLLHRVPAATLLVAPANRWVAAEVLRSPDRPDTANRATNTLSSALDGLPRMIVNPYLTDPDAWFLLSPPKRTGLMWVWRERPYRGNWFDDARQVGYYAIRYRSDVGWSDFNGVWGNPGAD